MRTIIYAALALCAVAFSSCDNQRRLADEMSGEWTCGVETLPGVEAADAQIIDNFAFVTDSTGKGGMIVATGMIEVTVAPPFDGQVVESVSKGIAAQSTVQGRWNVLDDDEVALLFDFSTMEVAVDTSAVSIDANLLGTQTQASTDSISGAATAALTQQLAKALREHYSSLRMLDDVKVKKDVLKFEVADKEYVMHRETTM